MKPNLTQPLVHLIPMIINNHKDLLEQKLVAGSLHLLTHKHILKTVQNMKFYYIFLEMWSKNKLNSSVMLQPSALLGAHLH